MNNPSILEAQNITPTCRTGRGDGGAWDEAVARLREIYDAQVAHDPSITLALAIFRGDFRAAQLATALAQPDTLGDGGGVVERVKALHRPRTVRIPYSDNHKVPPKQECAHCHRPYPCPTIDALTQPSATSERGGLDE